MPKWQKYEFIILLYLINLERLFGGFDEATGGYEHLAGLNQGKSPNVYGSDFTASISKRVMLKKGEKYALQLHHEGEKTEVMGLKNIIFNLWYMHCKILPVYCSTLNKIFNKFR